MKVYVLIRDETDYDGERDVFGVYPTYEAAKVIGDWKLKRLKTG